LAKVNPEQEPLRWWLTEQNSANRLTEQAPLHSAEAPQNAARVWVNSSKRFQTHLGFGGAFTESAAVNWARLNESERTGVLVSCFDPQIGHGYNLCRVHMNSCDFSLGNYAHVERSGDTALQSFSIARDKVALIPFIHAAQKVAPRPLLLLASPWSPPAWMKSNGQMNHGGHLLPQFRQAWADCYVRFIQAYASEGIPIWGVSVQNEPAANQRWDSCIYTAEEERDFVGDFLGPALHRAGLGHIKIIVWDHNRDEMVERANTVFSDPKASQYVWGTGFHWYVENHFDHVQMVHDAWPDKHLLFTEGCQEGGPHHGSWEVGERYGRSIVNDLNRWTEGWIDWNLLLDDTGGPNHVGNLCSAPLLLDAQAQTAVPQSSYFYMGHFARFIQPGAQRVQCAATREALECTAFSNPDGTVATVVMNRTEVAITFHLKVDERCFQVELPARAIATFLAA
jgi:glucosylceramidase